MNNCGHMICKDCLGEYIRHKLGQGTKVVYTKCFHEDCGNLIHEGVFRDNLDKFSYNKYHYYVENAFIESSKEFIWCPGLGCNKFAELKS